MASLIAIGSEAFDRCVGEIDLSVKVENDDGGLSCRLDYLDLFRRQKRLKICSGGDDARCWIQFWVFLRMFK